MEIAFSNDNTLYLSTADRSSLYNWGLKTQMNEPATAVRFVRGAKCRTTGSLFNEFAVALQFPYYFGENWDAFNDCITDLEWLNAEKVVIVVFDADQILADEPNDIEIFARILNDAKLQRTEGLKNIENVAEMPLYVVFQSDSNRKDVLVARLAKVNAAFFDLSA